MKPATPARQRIEIFGFEWPLFMVQFLWIAGFPPSSLRIRLQDADGRSYRPHARLETPAWLHELRELRGLGPTLGAAAADGSTWFHSEARICGLLQVGPGTILADTCQWDRSARLLHRSSDYGTRDSYV